jgi:hypothetical protein
MSKPAARRLRDALLDLYMPGGVVWDVTFTIPGEVTAEEWDFSKRALFMRFHRAGFAAIWRVELQKRGQPHLHVLLWTPPIEQMGGDRFKLVVNGWLEVLPEKNRTHPGAWKHAIHYAGPFSDVEQSPKWMAYLGAHTSKRKEEQLGWIGKQWGFVGRVRLQDRPPLFVAEIFHDEEKLFRRVLGRYVVAQIKDKRRKIRAKGRRTKGRVKRPPWHSGCKLTRFMSPVVVERILEWAKAEARRGLEATVACSPAGGRGASAQAGAGGHAPDREPPNAAPPSPPRPGLQRQEAAGLIQSEPELAGVATGQGLW